LLYKKPLFGTKSLGKRGKDGSGLALKVGCDIEN
jgi:hypothetical protein